jgi:D-alanyl-D-alanine dipeptidase
MPGQTRTAPPHPPASPAARRQAAEPATVVTPAIAARIRQLTAQAEHRHAITEFQARRAADQQARMNALLLEAIAALATLLGPPASHPPARAISSQ